jgi:HK97 family phage prohead protease
MDTELERVMIRTDEELRVNEVDGKTRIVGLAVPYGRLSADLGGYRERIMPGAFADSLRATQDMRADIEHDPRQILARTKKGTLGFHEDQRGVWATITIPDTPRGREAVEEVRAGNLDGMSITFLRKGVQDRFTKGEEGPVREVKKATMRSVTLTSMPAYPQTADTLILRSLEEWQTAEESCTEERVDTAGGDVEDLRRRNDMELSLLTLG